MTLTELGDAGNPANYYAAMAAQLGVNPSELMALAGQIGGNSIPTTQPTMPSGVSLPSIPTSTPPIVSSGQLPPIANPLPSMPQLPQPTASTIPSTNPSSWMYDIGTPTY